MNSVFATVRKELDGFIDQSEERILRALFRAIDHLIERKHHRFKRVLPLADYVDYHKSRCIDILTSEVGFRTYPYKHYESILTRFYQGYILPKKFGIDKRKVHLSSLVVSGQISRETALSMMAQSPYPSETELQSDIEYFLKKMTWSRAQLDEYIARPEIPHARYGTERPLWNRIAKLGKSLKLVGG